MDKVKQQKLPVRLAILDAIGAALLGIGLAERFAGTNLVPESFRFENYDIVMIAAGIVLMVPMVLHFLKLARNGAQKR